MKRIRILHTADLHLDASFAGLGVNAHTGNQLRTAQRTMFSKIMERAGDWPADMVLIAGDLFEGNEVQEDTIAYIKETLEHLAPIPVYIAPGNRDPYNASSPYATELWPENVVVFKPQAWQHCDHPLLDVCIHGIGCDGNDDSGDWFRALDIEADGRLHVAVAHGTEKNHQPEHGKCYAPFDAAAIAQENLAYLALGHFHDATEITGTFPTAIHYPGAPQGRNFNEQEKRYFLEVNIEQNGGKASVRTTPITCGEVLFKTYSLPVGNSNNPEVDLDTIIEGNPAHQVVRLEVRGTLAAPAYEYLEALLRYAQRRFLHVKLVDLVEREAIPPVLKGHLTCLSRFNSTMMARMTDAVDSDAALFQAYARDFALSACRNRTLPDHDGEEVLS